MVSCAKDATKFIVSVSFVAEVGSSYGCTPKPILAELGNPKKVEYTIKRRPSFGQQRGSAMKRHILIVLRVCPRTDWYVAQ